MRADNPLMCIVRIFRGLLQVRGDFQLLIVNADFIAINSPQIMMHAILATRMHYQLWESEDARRSYRSEQPMSLLSWQPPEETAMS